MVFDTYDVTLLRLCGLCRNLPCDLKQRYDHPVFLKRVADNLKAHRLIKMLPDRRCIKLTRMGKKVLADMGYEYPEDARPRTAGSIYQRRIVSAGLNAMLYCAGIDIFADTIGKLSGKSTIYIPSLTIRANAKSKALAGTRFLGILKIRDAAYVPYYVENEHDGIFPDYEEQTFKNQISNIADVKTIRLLFTGETLQILWSALFEHNKGMQHPRGLVAYGKALEVFSYHFCLVPLNRTGVLQISIMTQENYRKRIAVCFDFGKDTSTEQSCCDGIYESSTAIVAVDMDLKRIGMAIEESSRLGKAAYIICLDEQREVLQAFANAMNGEVNIKRFLTLKKETIEKVFPEMQMKPDEARPFQTGKGEYVRVNELGGTISKKAFER